MTLNRTKSNPVTAQRKHQGVANRQWRNRHNGMVWVEMVEREGII